MNMRTPKETKIKHHLPTQRSWERTPHISYTLSIHALPFCPWLSVISLWFGDSIHAECLYTTTFSLLIVTAAREPLFWQTATSGEKPEWIDTKGENQYKNHSERCSCPGKINLCLSSKSSLHYLFNKMDWTIESNWQRLPFMLCHQS